LLSSACVAIRGIAVCPLIFLLQAPLELHERERGVTAPFAFLVLQRGGFGRVSGEIGVDLGNVGDRKHAGTALPHDLRGDRAAEARSFSRPFFGHGIPAADEADRKAKTGKPSPNPRAASHVQISQLSAPRLDRFRNAGSA
jgi:hypothetical protein